MKTKHTPGPWKAEGTQIRKDDKTIASTHFTSRMVELINDDDWDREAESWIKYRTRTQPERDHEDEIQIATTKLITAAPELLEALLDVLENYKDGLHGVDYLINNEKIIKNALSIIQKATS